MLRQLFNMQARVDHGVKSITKKEIDPRAKAMLKDVIMKGAE